MGKQKVTKKGTAKYIEFLTKRLASKNFLKNESAEEIAKTKAKLTKAKLLIKIL